MSLEIVKHCATQWTQEDFLVSLSATNRRVPMHDPTQHAAKLSRTLLQKHGVRCLTPREHRALLSHFRHLLNHTVARHYSHPPAHRWPSPCCNFHSKCYQLSYFEDIEQEHQKLVRQLTNSLGGLLLSRPGIRYGLRRP